MRGPRAKIERAKEHIRQLEVAIRESLTFAASTNPEIIVHEINVEAGQQRYKVKEVPEMPDRLSTICGDIVHNLRASLDLLLGQLIVAASNTIGDDDYFPTAADRKKFEARCKSKIKGRVRNDAFKLICASEAYPGGNGDALWRLHRLDIEDKHKLLFVVGIYLRGRTTPVGAVAATTPAFAEQITEWMNHIFWAPAEPLPLKEGLILHVSDYPAKAKNEPKFKIDVAFGEVEVVEGKAILPTLRQLCDAVEQRVELFAALF